MKGRPILGVIAGFLFGLLLGPTLWLWGIIELASPLIWILPLVGIVFGLVMAAWAPFGKGSADDSATDNGPPVESDPVEAAAIPPDTMSEQPPSEQPPMTAADGGDESNP